MTCKSAPIWTTYSRDDFLVEYLNDHSDIEVTEAQCNEKISAQRVYIAPGGYHLQVEKNRFFSLSLDEKVNNSIPSIDVLFETAADCYADKLIGIILTGANCDGANGLKAIRDAGGYAIVEQPETAHTSFMPACALKTAGADAILPLKKISDFLLKKITT